MCWSDVLDGPVLHTLNIFIMHEYNDVVVLSGLEVPSPMGSRAHIDELKRDLAALRGEGGRHARADVGGHGRDAAHPTEIPSRGWRDVLLRSWREVSDANLFLVAGGVTYAILLALFPGLAALISLYGLVFDPAQVEKQIEVLSGVMPEQVPRNCCRKNSIAWSMHRIPHWVSLRSSPC